MTSNELRAESQMVQNESGGELTTRAAMLAGAADEIDRLNEEEANKVFYAECWQQHVSDLLDAIRPFYDLSSGANGRIPLDKPDYADWAKLWKAYKAAKTAMRHAPVILTPEGAKNLERVMDPNDPFGKPTHPAKACKRIDALNAEMIANEDRLAEAARLNTLRLTGKECL